MGTGDGEMPVRLMDVAALVDVRTACHDCQEIGQMLAKGLDIDALEERGQLRIKKNPVIETFGHARCEAASVFDEE